MLKFLSSNNWDFQSSETWSNWSNDGLKYINDNDMGESSAKDTLRFPGTIIDAFFI